MKKNVLSYYVCSCFKVKLIFLFMILSVTLSATEKDRKIVIKQKKEGYITFKYKGEQYTSKYNKQLDINERIVDQKVKSLYSQLKTKSNLVIMVDTDGNVEFFDDYMQARANILDTNSYTTIYPTNSDLPRRIWCLFTNRTMYYYSTDFGRQSGVYVLRQSNQSGLYKFVDKIGVLDEMYDQQIQSFTLTKENHEGTGVTPRTIGSDVFLTFWDGQNFTGNGIILQFLQEDGYGTWEVRDFSREVWPLNEWGNRIRSMELETRFRLASPPEMCLIGDDRINSGQIKDYEIERWNLGPGIWSVDGNIRIVSSSDIGVKITPISSSCGIGTIYFTPQYSLGGKFPATASLSKKLHINVLNDVTSIQGPVKAVKNQTLTFYAYPDNLGADNYEWNVIGPDNMSFRSFGNYANVAFTGLAAGAYYVTCTTKGNCSAQVTPKRHKVMYMPTPTPDFNLAVDNNILNVSIDKSDIDTFENPERLSYEIYNTLTGVLLDKGNITSDGGKIYLKNITKGVYLFKITFDKGEARSKKFIVN